MNPILDVQLFHLLYGWLHQLPFGTVWSLVSHLGDSKVVLSGATFGFLENRIRRATSRHAPAQGDEKSVGLPWVGIPVAALVTGWLKGIVKRPRPAQVLTTLQGVGGEGGYSFPSGHATEIFALATALSLRWPKGKMYFFAGAMMVALSRIALGKHWPSDLVAGAFVGWGTVVLVKWIEEKFLVERKQKISTERRLS